MSYEFKKISEVEVLETVSDEAHVLVEEDGAVVLKFGNHS